MKKNVYNEKKNFKSESIHGVEKKDNENRDWKMENYNSNLDEEFII